jgi:nucleotide-binding universal stress UspA family protein
MSEVILVLLQRYDTAIDLLCAAERLAALAHGAHLNVLAMTDSAPLALEAAYNDWQAMPRTTAVSARWHAVSENTSSAVEERGGRADLIVIARPAEDDDRAARQIFRTALLKTGRPVLVVPPGGRATQDLGSRVAIAWRQDEHTAKAVLPALRYIARAERVFLLAGLRKGGTAPAVPEVLAERQVPAELHLMPIDAGSLFGEALLAKAHDLGADLLVMGAYAHGALHNLVYGGVTRFMLAHADLPVLMRH